MSPSNKCNANCGIISVVVVLDDGFLSDDINKIFILLFNRILVYCELTLSFFYNSDRVFEYGGQRFLQMIDHDQEKDNIIITE